jgi:hypothetical protein
LRGGSHPPEENMKSAFTRLAAHVVPGWRWGVFVSFALVPFALVVVGSTACRPNEPLEPKTPPNTPLPEIERPDDPPTAPPPRLPRADPDGGAALPRTSPWGEVPRRDDRARCLYAAAAANPGP